jgi:type II secretory pathway component PulK
VYPNLGDYNININLLQLDNSILLSSIIPDLTIDQAKVLISEIPLEGFKSISELYTAFPNINFNQSYLPISLTTELLLLRSDLSSNEYSASATAIINFKNNKATILSRFYNGI